MKSIFIAGSRKFFDEMEHLLGKLRAAGINANTAGKWDRTKEDTFEGEQNALKTAFRHIDESDVCYVYAKEGYIGKTVAMEIAYAHARGKEIVSSETLQELPARSLVTKVLEPEQLIEYCK
ncbi:MAG: hypothetical protein ABIA93_04925 [Candidatus Woesearchaeota archaeon]